VYDTVDIMVLLTQSNHDGQTSGLALFTSIWLRVSLSATDSDSFSGNNFPD